ncbi:hypothetical protein PR048_018643 [Dryococelus australis]|uniref:Uncharacterized protein n=1 Tax=Dryococelus australis TaxID=614101 RepID=A0ABQ9HCZ9_9NEOP|nr:hypothetical protein PR048_018643 [Dryococelus australis]
MRIPVHINCVKCYALIDTAASLNFVRPGFVEMRVLVPHITTDNSGETIGETNIMVRICNLETHMVELFINKLHEDVILGIQWLTEQNSTEEIQDTNIVEHAIPTEHDRSIFTSPCSYLNHKRKIIQEQIREMLDEGVVEPTESLYNNHDE